MKISAQLRRVHVPDVAVDAGMKRKAELVSWVLLTSYLSVVLLFALYMGTLFWQQAHPEPGSLGALWCGNTVTDPLIFLLNWGAPVGFAAIVGLALSRRSANIRRFIVLPSFFFVVPTVALLVFGIWFFHGPPLGGSGFRIADEVWWLIGI